MKRATARIKVDGAAAGAAELVLVRRTSGSGFHAACDAESEDLQYIGVALCDDYGAVRPASVRDADAEDEADEGGFLYIETFHCDAAAHAPAAIRALLVDLPELQGKWTLGAYIGDGRIGDGRRGGSPAACEAAAEDDVRPFLRAGFAQVVELVSRGQAPVVFALPSVLADAPRLPASAEVMVAAPPPRKARSAESEQLFGAISAQGGPGLSAAFLDCARRLIREGASLAEACVLHVAVANGSTPAEVDELLALAPGEAERAAALTAGDSDGITVLMVAAASALSTCKKGQAAPTALCAHLIARGAEKGATDAKGRTAYDHAAADTQNIRDMFNAFGLPVGAVDSKALLQLLRV